jgi:multidrug efflux pump subunit AcrB
VPIIQVALSGEGLTEQNLADIGINQLRTPLVTVPGAAFPIRSAASSGRSRSTSIPARCRRAACPGQDVANALAAQNLITPVGTQKIGSSNTPSSSTTRREDGGPRRPADQGRQRRDGLCPRRRTVRDGNPPQTNIVHVDGNRSVLMMVLKAGATSTLDIIAGIKQKVIDVKDLAAGRAEDRLHRRPVGVRARRDQGVAVEGVIAALLTSVMILLFLGSWRSTVIIARLDPAVGARRDHHAVGDRRDAQHHDARRAGARGRHPGRRRHRDDREHQLPSGAGQAGRAAILDGANQIVTPAFVSLLCICIVFVPMFFLQGVARFLFVPMAEAVMFAMIWSFILSRTLVPTMAKYLLQPHVHHEGGPPPSRNPLVRFQRAFEARFEHFAPAIAICCQLALGHRRCS